MPEGINSQSLSRSQLFTTQVRLSAPSPKLGYLLLLVSIFLDSINLDIGSDYIMASQKGQRTYNFSFIVSADKEKEWDDNVAKHGEWMRETHALATKANPSYGMLGTLVDYYVSKAPEMNNPMDPSAGLTGNLIYTLNEVYTRVEGVEAHMEAAPSWNSFESFVNMISSSQATMMMNGEVIESM